LCNNRFKPFGYIKTGDFASSGFQIDASDKAGAIIAKVDPGSAAVQAGVKAGDQIIAVDGHPLAANLGEEAKDRLFGKIGDQFHVTVRSGKDEKTVVLQLAAKPKS
jgi:C-terminal processing protease CtpA/Prc